MKKVCIGVTWMRNTSTHFSVLHDEHTSGALKHCKQSVCTIKTRDRTGKRYGGKKKGIGNKVVVGTNAASTKDHF